MSAEASLKTLLLEGKIPDPFSKRFSWSEWDRYLALPQANDTDRELYTVAREFRRVVSGLLSALNQTVYERVSQWQVIESLIMYVNVNSARLAKTGLAKSSDPQKNYVGSKPRVQNEAETEYTIDDLHSFLADALKLPLERLLNGADTAPVTEFDYSDDTIADIPKIIEIASTWNAMQETWRHCLYHDHLLYETCGCISFEWPSDDGYFVLGRHREQFEQVSQRTSSQFSRRPLGKHRLSGLRRHGMSVDLRSRNVERLTAEIRGLNPFLRDCIIGTELSEATGIRLSEALHAWEVLSEISDGLLDRVIAGFDHDEINAEIAFDMQGRCDKNDVIFALQKKLDVSSDRAEAILALFTYLPGHRFDPWCQPVIDRGDGTLMLILGVLLWAHRSFAMESLMSMHSYNMDARGPALESYIRRELLSALQNCAFRNLVSVSECSVQLERGIQHEEVDLLISIGRDLYVVEIKATLFPVSVADDQNLKRKLKKADSQLTRKVRFLERNLRGAKNLHPFLKSLQVMPTRVHGIIVTNFPGGTSEWLQYPVCDVSSLTCYFRQGASYGRIELREEGSVPDSSQSVPYYNSYETFRTHFPRYLKYAPHAKAFSSFLTWRTVTYPLSQFGLTDIRVKMPEVILPESDAALDDAMSAEMNRLRDALWK